MSQEFQAIIVKDPDGGKPVGTLETLTDEQLPELPVTVDVEASTMNYKDALVVTGSGPLVRSFPMVAGIDLAGTVSASTDDRFAPGDRVLVNGYGLSERHWGGYTQRQRLSGDWLVRTPEAFSSEQAMAIGTAGYTAMLSVMAIQDHGITPSHGPIAVTGASGGVGSVALSLLSKLGFDTVAVTGRPEENRAYFESLGAKDVIARDDLERDSKPLERETFAGAVDSVGSKTLATVLAQTKYEGLVAACGLAAGPGLPSTVMPFILRGVTLRGIDSVMASQDRRARAWALLSELITPDDLSGIYSVKPMSSVPDLAKDMLPGKLTGRIVVDVSA